MRGKGTNFLTYSFVVMFFHTLFILILPSICMMNRRLRLKGTHHSPDNLMPY